MNSVTEGTNEIIGACTVAICRATQSTDDISNTIKTLTEMVFYSDKIPSDIKQNIEICLEVTNLSKDAQLEVAQQLKQSKNKCQQLLDAYQEWFQQKEAHESDIDKYAQKITANKKDKRTLQNKIKEQAKRKFSLWEKLSTRKEEQRKEDLDKLEKELGECNGALERFEVLKDLSIGKREILKEDYTTKLIPPSIRFIEHLAGIIRNAQIPVEQRKKTE